MPDFISPEVQAAVDAAVIAIRNAGERDSGFVQINSQVGAIIIGDAQKMRGVGNRLVVLGETLGATVNEQPDPQIGTHVEQIMSNLQHFKDYLDSR
jgi:hypothetical protein